ncbi:MAG TPA: DUF1214 domain-containing protein [Gemmatimonadaceae bacterium]|nr:DUF1214 domain-containing protein [Gemmatimonadaceae bacterium]
MTTMKAAAIAAVLWPRITPVAQAHPAPHAPVGNAVPVTADNFTRAETDKYFGTSIKARGIGHLSHRRDLVLASTIVRPNRDILYSTAVFDYDAGPVTVTLPDAGNRFMSMQVMDEDEYTHAVYYGAGRHTLTRHEMGTRYGSVVIRMLVNPEDPSDMQRVHDLQDAITVAQNSSGTYDVPQFDSVSQNKIHDALLVLGTTIPDTKRMFGTRSEVDPVRHLIGSAMLWGGLPEKDGLYLNVTPDGTNGAAVYKLTVRDVPVDGFWSITVYNAKGYFEPNQYNAYSLNNITAKKNADGSVAIQFGGCDGKIPNCLPTTPGWNYTVRLFRPRAEALNGTWTFPTAQLVH